MHRTLAKWAVALAPFVLLWPLIARWHNTIPLFDEWNMAELLRQHSRGELSLGDFWAQRYSDHRIVFPQLIIYGLARATSWTLAYEVVVSLLLALGTFLLLVHLVRASIVERRARWWRPCASVPSCSRRWRGRTGCGVGRSPGSWPTPASSSPSPPCAACRDCASAPASSSPSWGRSSPPFRLRTACWCGSRACPPSCCGASGAGGRCRGSG